MATLFDANGSCCRSVSNKNTGPHCGETSVWTPGFGRLVSGQLDEAQKIAALTGGPINVAHAPRTEVGK